MRQCDSTLRGLSSSTSPTTATTRATFVGPAGAGEEAIPFVGALTVEEARLQAHGTASPMSTGQRRILCQSRSRLVGLGRGSPTAAIGRSTPTTAIRARRSASPSRVGQRSGFGDRWSTSGSVSHARWRRHSVPCRFCWEGNWTAEEARGAVAHALGQVDVVTAGCAVEDFGDDDEFGELAGGGVGDVGEFAADSSRARRPWSSVRVLVERRCRGAGCRCAAGR